MKIKNVPGTYYARALIINENGWFLCGCFHSDKADAHAVHSPTAQWPVEVTDGVVYVPDEEELKDEI